MSTARKVEEWIGKTPDSRPPQSVVARLHLKQKGRCPMCTRRIGVGGEPFDVDHRRALINGGQNREKNLRLVCKSPCHKQKTREDVAEKSAVHRKRSKHVVGQSRPRSRWPGAKDSPVKMKVGGGWEWRK